MNPEKKIPDCPVEMTLQLIGVKWKVLIIRDLMTGTKRFNELMRSVTGITQKVLTQNLKALEQDGLVVRTVIPDTPPRTEYRLTERGKSLIPLLDAVYDWGWHVMKEEGLPIDTLGEMWHGYREKENNLMYHPFQHKDRKLP